MAVRLVLGGVDGGVVRKVGLAEFILLDEAGRDGMTRLDCILNAGKLDDSLAAVGCLLISLLRRAENDGEEHLIEAQAQLGA